MLPIILIGPMATGKSTIAEELTNIVDRPNVPMDWVRWYSYFKDGYSLEKDRSFDSFIQRTEYWKPFELKAIKRVTADFSHAIIDFGAGHSYYPDDEDLLVAKDFLKNNPNIFLLLPSPDKEKSFEICNKRLTDKMGEDMSDERIEMNRRFIFHKSNYELAKHIVYTHDRSPSEIALEIAKKIQ